MAERPSRAVFTGGKWGTTKGTIQVLGLEALLKKCDGNYLLGAPWKRMMQQGSNRLEAAAQKRGHPSFTHMTQRLHTGAVPFWGVVKADKDRWYGKLLDIGRRKPQTVSNVGPNVLVKGRGGPSNVIRSRGRGFLRMSQRIESLVNKTFIVLRWTATRKPTRNWMSGVVRLVSVKRDIQGLVDKAAHEIEAIWGGKAI